MHAKGIFCGVQQFCRLCSLILQLTCLSCILAQLVLFMQHDISQTLQIVQDILQLGQLQHVIEEVPDQEWVNAMKV